MGGIVSPMPSTDHTPQRPADAGLAERETHGMSAGQPLVVDSLSLLDHRTRGQMIPAQDAAAFPSPGRPPTSDVASSPTCASRTATSPVATRSSPSAATPSGSSTTAAP